MTEFHKILCPIDFDPDSLAALELAKSVAQKYQAKLYVLHVARIPTPDMDVPVPIAEHPHWEQTARERLEEVARKNLDHETTYELVVKSGIPEGAIPEAANDLGIDLIVMATHGRTGLTHLLMGSVAEEVVRAAACPVMVIKPQT